MILIMIRWYWWFDSFDNVVDYDDGNGNGNGDYDCVHYTTCWI
jgi:hypothetical protein